MPSDMTTTIPPSDSVESKCIFEPLQPLHVFSFPVVVCILGSRSRKWQSKDDRSPRILRVRLNEDTNKVRYLTWLSSTTGRKQQYGNIATSSTCSSAGSLSPSPLSLCYISRIHKKSCEKALGSAGEPEEIQTAAKQSPTRSSELCLAIFLVPCTCNPCTWTLWSPSPFTNPQIRIAQHSHVPTPRCRLSKSPSNGLEHRSQCDGRSDDNLTTIAASPMLSHLKDF